MKVNMKTKTMLLGLTLMLFPLPLRAMPTYVVLVGKDVITNVGNLASIDTAIETFAQGFTGVFQSPRKIITGDQVLVMRGGRRSLTRLLTPYNHYLVTASAACCDLGLYVCKVRNKLSKNVTYVLIHNTDFAVAPCYNERMQNRGIYISDVIAKLATLP
jgi:hypothetical protein